MPSESQLHQSTGLHVTVRDPRGGEAINLNFDREVAEIPLVVEFPSRTARAVLRVHHLKDAGEYDVRLSFTTDPPREPAAVAAVESSRSPEDHGGFSEADEKALRERAAVQGYADDDLSQLMSESEVRSEAQARAAFEAILSMPRDKRALAVRQEAVAAYESGASPRHPGVSVEAFRLALETLAPVTARAAGRILSQLVERAEADARVAGELKQEVPLPPPVTDAKLPVETPVVVEVPLTETKVEPKVEEKKGESGKGKHGGGSKG